MNNALRKVLVAIGMTICFSPVYSAGNIKPKKIALIIGIGKYQPGNGWNSIHGDNDVELVKHALMNTGFAETDILTLKNEKATKAGIVAAFKQLLDKAAADDIVVFHYSGHGQQVSDINGDEADGLDEALIPYDAPTYPKYSDGTNYEGNKHLLDDELGAWFQNIRQKIGAAGQLIAFIDACHSGTVSRGNGIVRGGVPPLILVKNSPKQTGTAVEEDGSGYMQSSTSRDNAALSKFVLFSAARAEEKDFEYKDKELGSLSYAVADAFENKVKSSQNSFRDLFEYVRNTMAIIVPSQNPQLEGDKDAQIFGGDIVIQEPFYRVSGTTQNGLVEIAGGRIMGIVEGTLVGLFPVGTRTATGTPVVSGKVSKADYLKSIITTDRAISADSALKLQAFILSSVFDNTQTKVFIKKAPAELTAKIKEQQTKKKIVFTDDVTAAALIIDINSQNKLEIQNASDGLPIINPFDHAKDVPVITCGGEVSESIDPATYIVNTIINYARNSVIKNATFSDKNFGLKIQLQPATINSLTNEAQLTAATGTSPVFNTVNSQAVLRIENTGSRSGYVYLVELDPSGKICPLLGFDAEIRLKPGNFDVTKVPAFAPPYGRYVMKGYITEEPIRDELNWLISEQNAGTRAAGSNNRLIKMLGELIQHPGSARGPGLEKSGGVSITNFSYDIKDQ